MAVLSVVIASYRREDLLRQCLASIVKHSDMTRTEIVVVDDHSDDDAATVAMVRNEFPFVRLQVLRRNAGFGVANNLGVEASSAPYVMLLNNDAVLLDDAGGGLVRFLEERPDVACVSPRIVLRNGARQPRVFGNLPSVWRVAMQSLGLGALFPGVSLLAGVDGQDRPQPVNGEVGWVSGVCMAMRRSDFLAVGGFDPTFFMYCEDVDLCARLSERGRIVRLDDHPVLHLGGGVGFLGRTAVAQRSAAAAQSSQNRVEAVWPQRLAGGRRAALGRLGVADRGRTRIDPEARP